MGRAPRAAGRHGDGSADGSTYGGRDGPGRRTLDGRVADPDGLGHPRAGRGRRAGRRPDRRQRGLRVPSRRAVLPDAAACVGVRRPAAPHTVAGPHGHLNRRGRAVGPAPPRHAGERGIRGAPRGSSRASSAATVEPWRSPRGAAPSPGCRSRSATCCSPRRSTSRSRWGSCSPRWSPSGRTRVGGCSPGRSPGRRRGTASWSRCCWSVWSSVWPCSVRGSRSARGGRGSEPSSPACSRRRTSSTRRRTAGRRSRWAPPSRRTTRMTSGRRSRSSSSSRSARCSCRCGWPASSMPGGCRAPAGSSCGRPSSWPSPSGRAPRRTTPSRVSRCCTPPGAFRCRCGSVSGPGVGPSSWGPSW